MSKVIVVAVSLVGLLACTKTLGTCVDAEACMLNTVKPEADSPTQCDNWYEESATAGLVRCRSLGYAHTSGPAPEQELSANPEGTVVLMKQGFN